MKARQIRLDSSPPAPRIRLERLSAVRPSRLWTSARLALRRAAYAGLARWFEPRADRVTLAFAERPPRPVFRPRRELSRVEEGEMRTTIQGVERALSFPIDWHANGSEREVLERHRMEWIEGLDDEHFQRVVCDWLERVRAPARGDQAAESSAIRSVVWMQQISARARRLPRAFVDASTRSIADQMRRLARNPPLDSHGRHSLRDIKAIAWAGAFFTGHDAERWRRRATELLEREMARQFSGDGLHVDRTMAIHARACADLLECRTVLADGRARSALDELLHRAVRALALLTHPDGGASALSGSGMHASYSTAEILEVYEREFGSIAEPSAHVSLADAGYYGCRSNKSLFLFNCGAASSASDHDDALACEWTVNGERILVGAGASRDLADLQRTGSRTEPATDAPCHDTLTLLEEAPRASMFRVIRPGRVQRTRLQLLPDGIIVEGLHDGHAHRSGEPIHRRLVRATSTDLRIEDHIEGGSGQDVCARFTCHPNARLTRSRDGVVTIKQGRVEVRVVSESPLEIVNAWWCPDLGLSLPTRQIVVRYGRAPRVGAIQLRCLSTNSTAVPRNSQAFANS